MTISLDKKYRTRDGRGVRLFVVDSDNFLFPVVGEILEIRGQSIPGNWTLSGTNGCFSRCDLIEITEPKTVPWDCLADVAPHMDKWFCQFGPEPDGTAPGKIMGIRSGNGGELFILNSWVSIEDLQSYAADPINGPWVPCTKEIK